MLSLPRNTRRTTPVSRSVGQETAVALLADVLREPALRAADVETERQVILEEIHLAADDPDDVVFDLLHEALFPDHPLGREVLGSEASVGALSRDDIAGFHDHWYRAPNLVVAAAGAVDHEALVSQVGEAFAGRTGGITPERTGPVAPAVSARRITRPTEADHMAWGWQGLNRNDPRRHALAIGVQVLGGGLSSRLFQTVREERGLAYRRVLVDGRLPRRRCGVRFTPARHPNGPTSSSGWWPTRWAR